LTAGDIDSRPITNYHTCNDENEVPGREKEQISSALPSHEENHHFNWLIPCGNIVPLWLCRDFVDACNPRRPMTLDEKLRRSW
jgi:hypothetical protein